MSKKDMIEILGVDQSYGKLCINARFNYPDGSWQPIRYKTSLLRPDEEIMDILQRKYEERRPERLQKVRQSIEDRKKGLQKKAKTLGKVKLKA